MRITVKTLLDRLNTIAPFALAEAWDNCGLQAGCMDDPVRRILVALDCSMAVMDEAVRWHADVVLTHHPLMMQGIKQLDFSTMPGAAVARCARENISIISLHTNLDKAREGLNDRFARMLGMQQVEDLLPSPPGTEEPDIGRIGSLEAPLTLEALADRVKRMFGAGFVRIVGDPNLPVSRVAVCTGSGESLLGRVCSSGVQAYITGDIKYHGARTAQEQGLGLIDVGHFASEHIVVDLLKEKVEYLSMREGLALEVKGYRQETDPFTVL